MNFERFKKRLASGQINTKSIVAAILFGAIAMVFVFFGFPTHQNATGVGSAAQVNNAYISVADLREELRKLEQIYSQFMGGQFGAEAQRQFLQRQALENLIRQELMTQAARRSGILISDAEVRDFVVNEMPVFQKEGRFQRDQYLQILQANQMTPGDFETKVRRDKQSQRLRKAFEAAAIPMRSEQALEKSLKDKKLNYQFVRIDREKLLSASPLVDQEIQKRLSDADFIKKVQEEFERTKSKYSTAEQVRAQHILIKTDPKNANSEKEALEKITQIRERASKEDFAKLAGAVSEDQGSKAKDGDLGYFGKGVMTPEFERVAFSQALGQISQPVKTPFGYHLVKVTDKKPASEASFDSVKLQVARSVLAQERFDESMKSLEAILSSADQQALDTWIKSHQQKWEETGFFEIGADAVPRLEGQTTSQALREISAEKPLLRRIVRDGENRYILRFKEIKIETAKAQPLQVVNSPTRSFELLSQWTEAERNTSRIEMNPQVLRQ